MKGGLELEYIVKFIIMLVAAAIVMMLMWNFYNDIKGESIIDGDDKVSPKTELVEQSSFNTQAVAKYVKSCWAMTGPDYDGDIVCYILKGSFEATPESVLNSLPADIKSNVNIEVANFAYVTSVIIEFRDLGNKITVSG